MKGFRDFVRRHFSLTGEEVRLVALIVGIALVGMAARYVYLRNRPAGVYAPPAPVPVAAQPGED